jgi:hypothetical protein
MANIMLVKAFKIIIIKLKGYDCLGEVGVALSIILKWI